MGVELSLNSPNARRRDYLYALADHPSRKVGSEKLGWPYGKGALEHEWLMLSPFREEKLREIAEHAIRVRDLDELRRLARIVETLKDSNTALINGIDREIMWFEHRAKSSDSQQGRNDAVEKLERLRQARQLAAEHHMPPERDPEYIRTHPYSQRSSTLWSSGSSSHHSSSHQEHSIEHSSRDNRAQ